MFLIATRLPLHRAAIAAKLEGQGGPHEGYDAGAKTRLVELDANVAGDEEAFERIQFEPPGSVGLGVGGLVGTHDRLLRREREVLKNLDSGRWGQ